MKDNLWRKELLWRKDLLCIYRLSNYITKTMPFYSYSLSWFSYDVTRKTSARLFPLKQIDDDNVLEIYQLFAKKRRILKEIQ